MAVLDDLNTAKAALAAKIADVLTSPKPTYSLEGLSISWSDYYNMLTSQMKALNELIAVEGAPYEYRTQAIS